MQDVRKRRLDNAVWVPLRAVLTIESSGRVGFAGHREEFFGAGSIAVPLAERAKAEKLGWAEVGIGPENRAYVEGETYFPADVYRADHVALTAVPLVLDQRGKSLETHQWHLHQDFVIALSLKREGDVWVSMDEAYVEVGRLQRGDDGRPTLLEVRAEHLKDYLCARNMALYVNSYRSRVEIVEDADRVRWAENPLETIDGLDRWEGRTDEIHEGGMPYGETTAVFHVERTDVDPAEDVPTLGKPHDGNIKSRSWTTQAQGKKLIRISGELWRSEWVEPAEHSPRVRDDDLPATVFFLTDAAGTRESAATLKDSGRWLWFRSDVMMALAHRRGGALEWHTRDTGAVRCSPSYGVDFGVNKLGLITVYAKDVALLPEWQQQIWAGFNVGPEGGVSDELLASQVRATPADTQAPEEFLPIGIRLVNQVATDKLGIRIFKEHNQSESILRQVHRFRAIDKAGLYALAKDVARLTADSIDAPALHRIVTPPRSEKWGSLKSLERVLAAKSDAATAHAIMGPLFAVYDLRLADAHLPAEDLTQALTLLGVNEGAPLVIQGMQLLSAVVTSIYQIARLLGEV